MFSLSFRNRIALYYLLSTAAIVLGVFLVIYYVVSASALADINDDLRIEVERHRSDVEQLPDTKRLVRPDEWQESEHMEIRINPIFVQIHDARGRFMEKSPNLKNNALVLRNREASAFHDTILGDIRIRQIQTPLHNKGKLAGYAVIAMSTEAPHLVIEGLKSVLYLAFPLVLLVLFFTTRFLAGRSIRPALNIIQTTSRITNNNFDERISLPKNRDELYVLSESINSLLDRIGSAILREKQFTSDASHELRTPLAVIKGTLEVLVRKPRDTREYEEKIGYCINEVDRLGHLVDQLLLLARFESQKTGMKKQEIALNELILESLQRFSSEIASSQLTIDFTFEKHYTIVSDAWLVAIIVENLLSNAIKYSRPGGRVTVVLSEENDTVTCVISDEGIGIPAAGLERVYEQFYRADATAHPEIKGTGLGLSLVKRLCDLLRVTLLLKSKPGQGTAAILIFTKT